MTFQEDILASLSVTEADAIKNIVSRKPFIYFGVITKVEGEGIVKVIPSVIDKEEDYFEIDCVLATVASQSVAVRIVPHVGDKVMVFSPMSYSNKMFLKENNGTLLAENSRGYSIFTGIAVLWNQVQKSTHLNWLDVDDGKITAHLAYDTENSTEEEPINNLLFSANETGSIDVSSKYLKDDEVYNVVFSVNSDGNISVKSSYKDDEYQSELSIDDKGKLVYKNPKASVTIADDGSFDFDNGKAKVTIDASGNVTVDTEGKFTFKNKSGKNLYTILKGTFQVLNQSLKTFGSPASHQVVPSQFQTQEADLDELMM